MTTLRNDASPSGCALAISLTAQKNVARKCSAQFLYISSHRTSGSCKTLHGPGNAFAGLRPQKTAMLISSMRVYQPVR